MESFLPASGKPASGSRARSHPAQAAVVSVGQRLERLVPPPRERRGGRRETSESDAVTVLEVDDGAATRSVPLLRL